MCLIDKYGDLFIIITFKITIYSLTTDKNIRLLKQVDELICERRINFRLYKVLHDEALFEIIFYIF